MGERCRNRCHHLNHWEHEDGSCCAHDEKRIAPVVPEPLKARITARARENRTTLSAFVRHALETFGSVNEAEPEPGPTSRIEASVPLYLANWIQSRDPSYVARRLEAYFRREKTDREG
jgi:hypothetical protein